MWPVAAVLNGAVMNYTWVSLSCTFLSKRSQETDSVIDTMGEIPFRKSDGYGGRNPIHGYGGRNPIH